MKYRILFFIVLVVLLASIFGISTVYVLGQIEESHMETAKLHLITAIEFMESSASSFFENEAVRVSDWSSDGYIREIAEKVAQGKSGLKELLGTYIREKKMPLDAHVLLAEVTDEQGHLLTSTATTVETPEENHLSLFDASELSRMTFGEHKFSLPVMEMHHDVMKQLMVHLIAPLFSLQNPSQKVGFLIIHSKIDNFFDELSSENIKTTFGNPKLYLFDRSGKTYLPKQPANLSKDDIGTLITSCETGTKKDAGFIREFSKPDGSNIIGSMICPSRGWWILYLAADGNEIMSQFMQGKINMAITLGIFFLLTLLIYAIVEFNTSRKIGAIVKVLNDVAKGNLKSRVTVRSNLFSEIIRSINDTINSLEKTSRDEHELEKLYRTLTDSSPIGIMLLDVNGQIVFLNKHAKAELGLPENIDVLHFDVLEHIDPRDRDMLKEIIGAALHDGVQREFEFRHIPGRGTEYCNGFLAPVDDANGQRSGVIFSSVDITDRKKAEERINALEQVKNEFISIAAHQIRTPITSILGSSEALESESTQLPEEDRKLVRIINDSVRKLNDFITFLISATRSESGATKFHLMSFDLRNLTDEVIATLKEGIEKKELTIGIIASPNPLPNVYTDREVVRQVIQNLISNAIRYSRPKGIISITIKQKDQNVEYSVADNGIGIPAAVQDKIFGKFFRAENAKQESMEGTGLGLSFARSLVLSWGGTIWFESKEGNGSTFYVTVPIVGTEEAKSKILA